MIIAHYTNTLKNEEGIVSFLTCKGFTKWILDNSYACIVTRIEVEDEMRK